MNNIIIIHKNPCVSVGSPIFGDKDVSFFTFRSIYFFAIDGNAISCKVPVHPMLPTGKKPPEIKE